MKASERLKTWSQTRTFRIIFGLIALVLAYVFASLALNSGNLLDYVITLLFVFIGFRELVAGILKRKK